MADIACTGRIYQATQTTLNTQGWEVLFKGEHNDEPNQNLVDLSMLTEENIEIFLHSINHYITTQIKHVKYHSVPFSKRQGIVCSTCQQGSLTKRTGKNGPFWSCNHYPNCKTTFPDDNSKPNLNLNKL
ncbi:topoisomerase DNA-binding C4 zinc finger domain-containing protein [Vibrio harveyi]